MFRGELRSFQLEAFKRLIEPGGTLVALSMGLGKFLGTHEPVLTPTGWVPIGHLRVGDYVIGQDGKPTLVEGVFPQGKQEIVRVTMQDGTWSDCGWDHLWTVITPSDKYYKRPWKTCTTRQLAEGGLKEANGNNRYQIPMVEPVHFDPVALPIEPYRLGVMLGDGCFGPRGGSVSLSTDRELLFEPEKGRYLDGCWHQSTSRYGAVLEKLGLEHHRSWEKFVPPEYLLGSPEERLALLQGLMDTDGYPMPDGGAEFSSTSSALIDAVVELTQSLGGVARGRRKAASMYRYRGEQKKGRPAERLNIKLPSPYNVFRLERKAHAYKVPTKYPPTRAIVSIEPTGADEAVCIKVSNPDGLYVTRSYIVTHNTIITIAAMEHLIDTGQAGGALIVVPASLKRQWARQIDAFTGGEANIQLVTGDRKRRVRAYSAMKAGQVEYLILNPESVVNDWDLVRHLPRDVVVIDECTLMKNAGVRRSRVLKRLPAKWRWGLTGQPVENRAEEVFSIMEWIDPDILGPAKIFDSTFIVRDNWGKPVRYRNLPLLHQTLSRSMVRKTWDDEDVRDQMPQVTEESVLVDFDPEGVRLYRYICDQLSAALADVSPYQDFNIDRHYEGSGSSMGAEMGAVASRYMCLRMLCDHPDLLRLSAAHYAGEGPNKHRTGSAFALELRDAGRLTKVTKSPKLDATVDLIEEILGADPRNKVVLFSFFKDALDLVAKATARLTDSALFTGDLDERTRDMEKVRFQTSPTCRLFLSSDAGGYGVDLPQANYLISLDLPWSGGAWQQRNARIVRLSSEFEKVTVISMLMAGSVEERQYDVLTTKQTAARAILDGRGADSQGVLRLDQESLSEFVRTSTV